MDLFEKCFRWQEAKLTRQAGLYPYFVPIEETEGTEVVVEGHRKIMIGSNNYLGLTMDPRVKGAAKRAVDRYGSSCSGSRFLNGTLALHEELEANLASFLGKESAIVFSTGFQTNQGTLAPLLGRGDIAFSDKSNHASIVDGLMLSGGEMKRFKHRDLDDLERLLTKADSDAAKLIVVDGVFSMEGDLSDLAGLVALKKKHGARLMVDDAHGIGVLGDHGRGTCEHFGVEADVDLVMGTFSKSFASLGGVIAGPADVLDWIKHRSRALIFSASMSPASLGACAMALEIIQSEPERRTRLAEIAAKMREGFHALGFNTGDSVTPVIPIVIGDDHKTFAFWRGLLDAGVFTNPVISPAVAPGKQLLRTSYMATHTDEQLDRVLDVFAEVGRAMGVIGDGKSTAAV